MVFIPRFLEPKLRQSLNNTPILYMNGPRQAGKSTLCRSFGEDFSYVTLDKATVLAAAVADPIAFIHNLPPRTIIDEVQLAPGLFRPMKYLVDELRLKKTVVGHFLLTGSANIMAIPNLADSLVGRMQTVTLLPFSAAEILNGTMDFIPSLFEKAPVFQNTLKTARVEDLIYKATFPDVALGTASDQAAWYENYISMVINRDIRALADIEKIAQLPRMLSLLAGRAGNLLSHASFARDVGLPTSSYKRYFTLFEHVYLTILVKPWFKNITKRLVKSPKLYFTDTALLMALLGRSSVENYPMKGAVLENFVASELTKHIHCLKGYNLFHFRTSDDREVDFVIERTDGALIGIEVKYTSSVDASDFKGLRVLKDAAPQEFVRGIVLYQGTDIVSFGKDLFAMPLRCLYSPF